MLRIFWGAIFRRYSDISVTSEADKTCYMSSFDKRINPMVKLQKKKQFTIGHWHFIGRGQRRFNRLARGFPVNAGS